MFHKIENVLLLLVFDDLEQEFNFPYESEEKYGNLKDIIQFSMEGAIKIEPEDLDFDFDDKKEMNV